MCNGRRHVPLSQIVQTKNKQCKLQLYYNVIIRIYLTSVPDPG